jgi:hypothetical protein
MVDNSVGRLRLAAASTGTQMGARGEGVLAWIAISAVAPVESCATALESELALVSSEVTRANDLPLPHRGHNSRLRINCRYWADLDGNGEVEIEDVRLAAARWNTTRADSFYLASFDVDGCGEGDGDIDVVDVQLLVSQLKARGAPWPPCSGAPTEERERSTFLRLQSRGSDGDGVHSYQLFYEQGALPAALEFSLVLASESRLISFYAGAGLQAGLLGPSPAVSQKPRLGAYFLRSPQENPSAHVLLEFKIKGACSDLQNFLAVAPNAEPLAVEFINATEVKETGATAPAAFALHQNYPNPFSCNGNAVGTAATTIRFDIPAEAGTLVPVHLAIYDLQGKLVKTLLAGERIPGAYQTAWNGLDAEGRHLASGIYFVRLEAGKFVTQRKATLVR